MGLILSLLLVGCKADGGKSDSSLQGQAPNDEFVEYRVKVHRRQLEANETDKESDIFFVNDQVFKESFFELLRDKPAISQNIDKKLVYEVKKSD